MANPVPRLLSSAVVMFLNLVGFVSCCRLPFLSPRKWNSAHSDLTLLSRLRGGEIVEIQSLKHAEEAIREANEDGKLVVFDFTAYNCPPCKKIAPLYEELSESEEFHESVVFLKVNVNDNPDVAEKYSVDGWPTFLFIKDLEVQDSIVGGSAAELGLYNMVIKYSRPR